MALSGSTSKVYTTKGAYWVWVEWTATQNIADNTSTITAITYGGTNSYGYYTGSSNGSTITIDGTAKSVGDSGDVAKNTAKRELCRNTVVVAHAADGTKSFSLSGRWWYNSGAASFDLTSPGTFTLDTIPRASSISSFPNFNIGSGVTVGITRASTAFTHAVGLYLGSTHISTKYNVTTGVTFSAADVANLYNLTSSSSSATVTVYVETYNGTTKIGNTVSANATAVVESGIVPSLSSVSAVEDVAALVGVIPAGTYLQNYSKIKFTINGATAGKGASIASYQITFNGSNYTSQVSTTGTINATGDIVATATVKDTRGRTSAAQTVSCTLIAFPASLSAPNFTIGSGFTATLNRPHTNITNQFVLKYGTTTIKDTGKISANAYTFTAADLDAIYAQIPNSVSGTVSLTATAYAGTTAINTKTSTLTASVGSDIIPTFTSVSAVETAQAIIDIAMGANQFVQSLSRIKFTISGATKAKSSPIASYNINFNGINYGQDGTTDAISTTGDIVVTATVTDTRGRTSAAKTLTVKLHAYKTPAATFTAARDAVLTETVKTTGSSSISSLNAKNQLTYKVDYKLKTATTWTNKTPATALAIGTLTFNPVFTYTGNGKTYSYDYRLTISDRVGGTTSIISSVGTEQVAMSWGKFGIGVGKVYEDGALDVKGNTFLDGNLNLTGTLSIAGGSVWHSGNFNPASYVPTSRTVNGKALSANISLTAADVGAAASSHTHSYLPLSGGTLTGSLTLPGSIVLAKDSGYNALRISNPSGYLQVGPLNEGTCHLYTDRPSFYFNKALIVNGVGVSMDGHTHSYVPTGRTVNGKALSANISLTAADVGAAASSHSHAYQQVARVANGLTGNITSSTWSSVSFGKTFPSAPSVAATGTNNVAGESFAKVRNVSTTGFEIVVGGTGTSNAFRWIAILEG